MPVKWTRTALRNLDNAIEYIAEDRPIAAKEVGQKIWDSAKLLADHPGMGRPGRVPGTRELVVSGMMGSCKADAVRSSVRIPDRN
ncbi:type II toxin-antitoxin system RelE/ParE family toxin [uncultured Desulfobacter sp.]|uniref:type II toxin-antitoxin system RelE/ParE family toxin n=1 Tax=uncultured Desulfobacter sp. TaxID=240139 RepID=UPI00374A506D